MYRRPYPRRKRETLPPFDPTLPAIARHTLPEGEQVATALTRFVGQVIVASTIAFTAARVLGGFWPEFSRTLFGVAAVVLLIVSGFKWLWIGRRSHVPWLAIVTGVIGAIWVLSLLRTAPTVLALMGVIVAAWIVAVSVQVVRFADGATSKLDSGTSLALAGGAFLLFALVVLPSSADTLFALTICANLVLALAVGLIYVEFVLAHPGQPRRVIQAGRKRWKSILWGKEARNPSPVVVCAFGCVAVVVVVALLSEPAEATSAAQAPAPENGAEGAASTVRNVPSGWLLAALNVLLPALVGVWIWKDGQVIRRAFTVWMMYDGAPTPGVYRPHRWLAPVRRRQVILGAVLFLNVLFCRTGAGAVDVSLLVKPSEVLKWLAEQPGPGILTALTMVLPYVGSFFFPALMPVVAFCLGCRVQARTIHDLVEETTPPDLYPPFQETNRG